MMARQSLAERARAELRTIVDSAPALPPAAEPEAVLEAFKRMSGKVRELGRFVERLTRDVEAAERRGRPARASGPRRAGRPR